MTKTKWWSISSALLVGCTALTMVPSTARGNCPGDARWIGLTTFFHGSHTCEYGPEQNAKCNGIILSGDVDLSVESDMVWDPDQHKYVCTPTYLFAHSNGYTDDVYYHQAYWTEMQSRVQVFKWDNNAWQRCFSTGWWVDNNTWWILNGGHARDPDGSSEMTDCDPGHYYYAKMEVYSKDQNGQWHYGYLRTQNDPYNTALYWSGDEQGVP